MKIKELMEEILGKIPEKLPYIGDASNDKIYIIQMDIENGVYNRDCFLNKEIEYKALAYISKYRRKNGKMYMYVGTLLDTQDGKSALSRVLDKHEQYSIDDLVSITVIYMKTEVRSEGVDKFRHFGQYIEQILQYLIRYDLKYNTEYKLSSVDAIKIHKRDSGALVDEYGKDIVDLVFRLIPEYNQINVSNKKLKNSQHDTQLELPLQNEDGLNKKQDKNVVSKSSRERNKLSFGYFKQLIGKRVREKTLLACEDIIQSIIKGERYYPSSRHDENYNESVNRLIVSFFRKNNIKKQKDNNNNRYYYQFQPNSNSSKSKSAKRNVVEVIPVNNLIDIIKSCGTVKVCDIWTKYTETTNNSYNSGVPTALYTQLKDLSLNKKILNRTPNNPKPGEVVHYSLNDNNLT